MRLAATLIANGATQASAGPYRQVRLLNRVPCSGIGPLGNALVQGLGQGNRANIQPSERPDSSQDKDFNTEDEREPRRTTENGLNALSVSQIDSVVLRGRRSSSVLGPETKYRVG